ncbi:hypothetical protein [Psychrobium sp. 1_MG-2023]|uniref:hypothetical protein n=1 Tax=Psychrobium sp. 1_MG-2023 TaxID=3062624 RepID=UPI000C344DC4|nr:hypothetical protein [Psychrobium sp. 1_MG-2023]MDP2561786.1 hypothetical protein [Psychrobium sp. 1_MG-2023]PKF59730.1 hypothetical protein CW748_00580 [Alteromonadales bacterium alter-6D02]
MNVFLAKESQLKRVTLGLGALVAVSITPVVVQANQINVVNAQQQYEAIRSIRDPFTPSSLMFDTMSLKGSASGAEGYGFMRSPSNANLPKMRLRGYIGKTDDKPVALLEVAGNRTYIIHEGDEINIDPTVPNSAIRITKITRFSVTVEAGMLGSIRVQR